MNTKKVVIVAACAAVLVGSAFAFRKVKKEVTRILKAEEPKDDDVDSKPKFDGCDARAEKLNDCCGEARNHRVGRSLAGCDCIERTESLGDCCEASCDCEAMAPMGKARLVD